MREGEGEEALRLHYARRSAGQRRTRVMAALAAACGIFGAPIVYHERHSEPLETVTYVGKALLTFTDTLVNGVDDDSTNAANTDPENLGTFNGQSGQGGVIILNGVPFKCDGIDPSVDLLDSQHCRPVQP